MPLDEEVTRALNETVKEMGQPDAVVRRLVAWLEKMSEGEVTSSDMETFLGTTMSAITSKYGGDDEN